MAVLLNCENESDGNCNQNEALRDETKKEPFGFQCSSLFEKHVVINVKIVQVFILCKNYSK